MKTPIRTTIMDNHNNSMMEADESGINTVETTNISQDMAMQDKLTNLQQTNPSDDITSQVRQIKHEINEWHAHEEEFYWQQSRDTMFREECISTTEIQLMLNGSPCTPFKPTRGIRQGDPVSPYLFLLTMEVFTRSLVEAERKIQGIKIAKNASPVSHLLFADDCMLFVKDDLHNVNNLLLKMKKMSLHERYLGIPLFLNRRRTTYFSSLVEGMKSRLFKWNGKFLTQSGRSIMVKHVINAMPSHQMGVFKIPKATIKEMDRVQRRFWWNKKNGKGVYLTSWERVNCQKEIGAMGFRYLECFNKALLSKSVWRLCHNSHQLWASALKERNFPDTSILHATKKKNTTWAWQSIFGEISFVQKHSFWLLGDGKKIITCKDNWIIGKQEPPVSIEAFELAVKYSTVRDLIDADTKAWKVFVIHQLFSP
ncbi:uncharacterized protein LOC113291806 [Papaver somniferum]|uniref:uncharacterized protein LOC113291806 n=1 Tax=Papaver somniferum TaxID=3469 RepID=UPI000E6FBD98|nr:uncharacterized protein LOC113291806 [Papaver somniferum]